MPQRNVFDVNDIRATGATVEGQTVLSGNSSANILTVTGASGTNMIVTDDETSNLLWGITGDTGAVADFEQDIIKVYKQLNITGNTNINGDFSAISKSFDIPHPSKEGMRLKHGVLEGPEHAVYYRGQSYSNYIQLPDYWDKLVDLNTITVQLTPIGDTNHYYYQGRNGRTIYINSNDSYMNYFFLIIAQRIDVPNFDIEY